MLAFGLWAEGLSDPKHLEEMRSYPPGRYEIVAGEYKVERCKIPDYFDEDFWHNLRIWDICQEHGLPYPDGWARNSTVLMQMLQLFDAAKTKIANKKVEEDGNLGRAKSSSHGRHK
jgi:hypothetical protein